MDRIFTIFFCLVLLWWKPVLSIAQIDEGKEHAHQNDDSVLIQSSRVLASVMVYGNYYDAFSAGFNQKTFNQQELQSGSGTNLGHFLLEQTGIYIREYGANGQISTVSMRGAGPGHTAVLWNGININSPSLGLTDFSLIPLAAISTLGIQYGSQAALYSSDAVGGVILLSSGPDPHLHSYIQLEQQIGSFGLIGTVLSGQFKTDNLTNATKVYFNKAENNFWVQPGRPNRDRFRQPNAGYEGIGVTNSTNWSLNSTNELDLDIWYHRQERDVQPARSAIDADDHQSDENLRSSLLLKTSLGAYNWINQLGYVFNYQQYNDLSPIRTKQVVGRSELSREIRRHRIKAGAFIQNSTATSATIFSDANLLQTDLYVASAFRIGDQLETNLNLRQVFIRDGAKPFIPSLSATYWIMEEGDNQLSINIAGGRSFKAPTINQVYWNPGGNPDIRPENGWNMEGGVKLNHEGYHYSLTTQVRGYGLWMRDWIIWLPQGGDIWSPENVQQVRSTGLETDFSWKQKLGQFDLSAGLTYAFTKSINQSREFPDETSYGNQLPYVPVHRSSGKILFTWNKWNLLTQGSYTSKRYASFSNLETPLHVIDAFTLFDCSVGYQFNWRHLHLEAIGWVRNIFNADYENAQFRASPGRNYMLTIRASSIFNNK